MTLMQQIKHMVGRSDERGEDSVDACPHRNLAPRWDSISDMGHSDRITEYRCDTCQQSFSREEGDRLLAREKPGGSLEFLNPAS